MANNKVTIDLQIASQGMDPAVQKSQTIKDNLTAAAGAMNRTGGTTGSRAVSEKAAGQEYAAQRAVAGATGASARNFAAESQGLGGLVRLYATFAANTYAAAAAFKVLSEAMDTANMAKGLDQLGAASGRNLGTMSKSLVSISQGTISLREAMDATVKASSAGLSGEQINRMGAAAVKTSQALGVNMTDALSRLSRGITKLEPELLDELGIYTKLDQSTNDYARSIGKSAAQLTDFEKRQAFANAVLTEAETKFGRIKLDANPYDKLAASFKNLAQTGLDLVNKVFTPIVSILASSPTALMAVIAGIGTMLLKQAIPAIGQYKQALQDVADKSLLAVSKNTTSSGQQLAQKIATARQEAESLAEVQVTARDTAIEKYEKLKSGSFAKEKAKVGKIFDAAVLDVPKESLDYLDAMAKKNLVNNKKLSDSYREIADTIRAGQAAERNYIAIREKELLLESELAATAKARQLADAEFKKLATTAISRDITAKTAAAAKELGLVAALTAAWRTYQRAKQGPTELNVPTGKTVSDALGNLVPEMEKVTVPAITKGAGALGMLKTGLITAGSAAMGLVSKLTAWGLALSLVKDIGSTVLGWMGDTEKESEATAKALDTLSEAGKNVARTLDDINARPALEKLTVESVLARTNAFKELTDAMSSSYKVAKAEMGKMNPIDSMVDSFKSLPSLIGFSGQDVQSKTGAQFAKGLQAAMKAAAPSAQTTSVFAQIEKELGVSIRDVAGIEKAFKSLGGTASLQIQDIIDRVAALSKEQQKAANITTDLKEAWKQGSKDLTAFMTSAMPQDALSKLAQDQMSDALKLQEALKNPITQLATMKELANDINALKLFPPNTALKLAAVSGELNALSIKAANADSNLSNLGDEFEKTAKKRDSLQKSLDEVGDVKYEGKDRQIQTLKELNEQLDDLTRRKTVDLKIVAEIETKKAQITKLFEDGLKEQFVQGANILSDKIGGEWVKAKTIFSSGLASAMGNSFAANKIKFENTQASIKAEQDTLKSQASLIIATNKLADQIELDRISREKPALESTVATSRSDAARDKASAELRSANAREDFLKKKAKTGSDLQSQIGLGSKALTARFNAGDEGVTQDQISQTLALEAIRAKLAQEASKSRLAAFDQILDNLKTTNDYAQQELDTQAKSTQERLAEFEIIAANNQALSEAQLIEKEGLLNASAAITAAKEIANIDAEIMRRRIIIANTADATARLEMVNQVVKLENTDKQLVLDKLGNTLARTRATTETSIRDINKEILDVKQRTADVIATSLAQSTANQLDIDKTRLDVLKATNKISEKTYLTEKAAQDKRSEDLNRENTLYALKKEHTQKLAQLDENIRKFSENKALKTQYEEEKTAEVDSYESKVANVKSLTLAKKLAIDEIAEYEKSRALTEGVADAIVTALTEGGKAGSKKLRDVIIAELKKPITLIVQALVNPIVNGISGMASTAGSALASAGGSMLGSIGSSLFGASFTGASLKGMATEFGTGIATGFNATIGATSAEAAAVAAGTADIGIGAAAAGTSTGSALGSLGSTVGAALPYVAAAAVVLAALGAFRTTEIKDQGITGTLGGGGPIESYQTMRKSGYILGGPDYWTEKQSFALSEAIQSAFKDNRTATATLAENLNLNSTAVQNFTTTLGKDTYRGVTGISFKDAKTPEQMMQKIQEALVAADEELAKVALGTDKYNKLNETSRNALNRLSTSLTLVNDMFKDLGFDLKDVGLEGADAASKLIDALGGASAAQSKLAFVYDKFYTEEQKQANILNRTTTALSKLNLELPTSRDAYVALLDTATKLGDPKTLAALVDLAPAIDALYPAIEPVVESMSLLADYMELSGDKAGALALRRSEELKNLNALDAATQRRIYALQDEKDAYDKLHTALTDTIAGLKTSVKSLRDFSTSVLTGPNSTLLSPGEKLATLQTSFDKAILAAQGPRDTAEGRKLADEAAQDVVRYGQQLVDSATTMFASGPESQRIIKDVASASAGVADKLALAQTDAEKTVTELETSNGYLKTIDYSIGELLQQYKDAKLASDTVIAALAPNKAIVPVDRAYAASTGDKFIQQINNEAPVATAETISTDAKNQNALLMENNKLLQKQIELQAEVIRSNAVAMKAQTDALNTAAEDRRLAEEYAERNKPTEYVGA